MEQKMNRKVDSLLTNRFFLVFALLFLALTPRLYLMLTKDFWFDEAFSFLLAKNSVANLIAATASDNNPPFYYLLLHSWLKISQTEFFLRFPSLVFNLASIFLIYRLGKKLFNEKIGLIASFLFSFSPLSIYYAVEARMYALLIFTILMALWFFLKTLELPRATFKLGFFISCLVALYISYSTIFFLLSLGVYLLINRKKYARSLLSFLLMGELLVLGFAPWLKIYLQNPHPTYYTLNQWLGLPVTFASFVLGGLGQITLKTMFSSGVSLIWRTLFLLLLLFSGSIFLIGLKNLTKRSFSDLLLILIFVPLVIVFLISFWQPIFSPRILIIFSPVFYLIVAGGLAKFKGLKLKVIIGLLLIVNLTTSLIPFSSNQFNREPLKKAAVFISQNYQPGDVITHSSIFTYYPFRYYHQDRLIEFLVLPTALTSQTMQMIGLPTQSLETISLKNNRLWFVNIPDRAYPQDIQKAKDFLDQNLQLLEKNQLETIEVYLYRLYSQAENGRSFDR